jgi:hypothetical protein
MQALDYEIPRKHKRRPPRTFWLVFAIAYMIGIPILDEVNDAIHMRLTGHHNDGGIMFLSVFVCPLFAGAAALIKGIWKRYESIGFAAAFPVLAPILVYLLWVSAEVYSK